MSKKFFKGSALALLAAAVLLGGNALAQDTSKAAKPKPKAKTTAAKPGAPSVGGKVKFIRGSEETPAQRSARLKRECKGGVDAGACSGHTR